MPRSPRIGRSEMEILRYVADHHPIAVGEVGEHMSRTAGYARTTVLTVLERLRRKGHLERKKRGGVFHYAPRLAKADLLKSLIGDFVDRTLGGSLSPFVAYLSETAQLSDEELNDLQKLVRDLKDQRKEAAQ